VSGYFVVERDIATQIRNDLDIITARSVVRDIARGMGFGTIDQARIATAVSEISRTIFLQAGVGHVIAREIDRHGRRGIEITFQTPVNIGLQTRTDAGQTHRELSDACRLVDEHDVRTHSDGSTVIVCRKWCP
jgi:serine/threonine-protein kinase RsbT